MAGNQAALRNYIDAILLVPVVAREAVMSQGVTSFEDFIGLTDKDMQGLLKNVRTPGGNMQNPNWVPGGAMPQVIRNSGAPIGYVNELRFRQLRFYRNYLHLVQRPMVPALATLARLQTAWAFFTMIEEAAESQADVLPEKMKKTEDARKILENLDHYLNKIRNRNGIPLSYMTRSEVEAPDLADDPGYASPSFEDEMKRRASHVGETYNQDNKTLWGIIRHITHGGPAWNWVSVHSRSMNGRQAYLDLKGHYMGASFSTEIKNTADMILSKAYYDGRKRNYTFENYAERITKAYDDLKEAGEDYGDERKVRRLLSHMSDPKLAPAKSIINSNPLYRDNYQNAITFLKSEVSTELSSQSMTNRNIGLTETGRGRGGRDGGRGRGRGSGRGRGRGRGRGGRFGRGRGGRGGGRTSGTGIRLTDGYIGPEDWNALTRDEQQYVFTLRDERDSRRNVAAVNPGAADGPNQTTGGGPRAEGSPTDPRAVGALMSRRELPGRGDPAR
jgi:hypothetical protein